MIAHGRAICRARVPQCAACVLLDICPEGSARMAAVRSAPRAKRS
jgi:endonuclease-3